MRAQPELFSATRDSKGLLDVFKRLPVVDYLKGEPILQGIVGKLEEFLNAPAYSLLPHRLQNRNQHHV